MTKSFIVQATGGQPTSFSEDPDGDLFRYAAMAGQDPSIAQAAFSEIYGMHKDFVHSRITFLLKDRPELNPDDLFQDTFARAYEKAHLYKRCVDGTSREKESRYTRSWLFKIAENLFYSSLRTDFRLRKD